MLWRKLIRDLRENKMAYIACLIVISIGLMAYTTMSITMDNLSSAKDEFYQEYRLADGFAQIKTMPKARLHIIDDVDGIEKIQGRLVKEVRVLWSNREDNVYLRLISIDPADPSPLNDVQRTAGIPLESNKQNIWIGAKFFEANGLKLGEAIPVVIEGKKVELTIVGTGQSPEYVYTMQNAQSIMPNPEAFDVAYLPYSVMETLFQAGETINDIVFTLEPGYTFEDVEETLRAKLKAYGLEVLFAQKDLLSFAMLEEELHGIETMAQSVPVLFLGISAIILYIMLKRLVEQQRGMIGTLKAFGYTQGEILFHYLSYSWIIGLGGGIVGGLLGSMLSGAYTGLLGTFFNLPNLTSDFSWRYFILGIVFSVLGCLLAGFQGVKGVLKLQPAEGMRSPVPVSGKRVGVEKIKFLWNSLTVQGRMAIRNIFRSKGRSFFTGIGVMFTFAMMATMWSFNDLADTMVMDQFTKVQTYDVKVSFTSPVATKNVTREFHSKKGIKGLETMLEVPATFKNTYHKKDVVILGLEENSQMYNIVDDKGRKVRVPREGILLSEQIAKQLHVQAGDRIQLESGWAKQSPTYVYISGIIPQYLGSNAYMEEESLGRLLGQGEISTSALLAMDTEHIADLKEIYKMSGRIQSIEESWQTVQKYNELMGSYAAMMGAMVVIAIVTGFAIVYNSSIISLAERKRELASLRVLGMTNQEVLEVISFEQWFVGMIGIVLGVPLTFAFKKALADSMSSDLYTMPVATEPSVFMVALVGTVIAMLIAQISIARAIRKMDMVEVLKERE